MSNNRGRRGRYYDYGRNNFQPYSNPSVRAHRQPSPIIPVRDYYRAFAAVVVSKVECETTVDRSVLQREVTTILEQPMEMKRVLVAAEVSVAGENKVLQQFIKILMDEPMKVAGLLGAIKAPTVEYQQLEEIKAQLEALKAQLGYDQD